MRKLKPTISTKLHRPKRRIVKPLPEDSIHEIVDKMPGGIKSFSINWGWLTFAREIERMHGIK